jgi:hypothetical protein
MVDDEERCARMLRRVHIGEDGINLVVDLVHRSLLCVPTT